MKDTRQCNVVRHRCLRFIQVLKENGYEKEVPLETAKELFMKTLGIMDRLSLQKYFGSQPSRSIRKIQRTAQYSTGTLSYKTIVLAQEIPKKKGYFEILGLAKIEPRGQTLFMTLTNQPLTPEIVQQQ